jgi:hypothetical protein
VLQLSARPQLRAPKQDGAVLAEPPLAAAGELIARNRRRLDETPGELLGRTWPDLRREARQTALAAARRYYEATTGEPAPDPGNPDSLLLAGHQPELFHPGVWVKNFALAGLARVHGVTALNLVVDNDTVKSTALRLPSPATAAVAWPHVVSVPFDRWTGEIPYEERPILDRQEFAGFAERSRDVLAGWDYEPLLASFWPEVLRQTERTPLLGECFAAARRTFERRWGCRNLEVTVGDLCQTATFAWFACHLLSELPRFHAIYNACVHDYRKSHGIRSRNHPVPDLAADGDWLETPFWAWKSDATRRGRLFARRTPGSIELLVGEEVWPSLPADNGEKAVAGWKALAEEGRKIRSRALANTLYARLFPGDLFVHGIGGGKYDELTDEIIRRFYHIEAPEFIVLTATRLLPLPHFPSQPEDCRRLQRSLRDFHWNPQRHLTAADAGQRELMRQRNELARREPADKAARRERFRTLRELTERLREPLAGAEHRLRDELAACERQVEANEVLTRRDYSFVLYPEETLRPFCEQFL